MLLHAGRRILTYKIPCSPRLRCCSVFSPGRARKVGHPLPRQREMQQEPLTPCTGLCVKAEDHAPPVNRGQRLVAIARATERSAWASGSLQRTPPPFVHDSCSVFISLVWGLSRTGQSIPVSLSHVRITAPLFTVIQSLLDGIMRRAILASLGSQLESLQSWTPHAP